jgi:ABC-type nitrate/sulfonate/bicarbonate transport system substrate-binding protein
MRSILILGILFSTIASSLHGLEKVRLQLKWRHQFQFAGYYAAIEKGYYAEAGLDVELLEPQPETAPTYSVLRGDAEFGISNSDLLLLRAEGLKVVALASIFQHSPLVFAALKGKDIETIHDLAGKRIMM